MTPRLFRPEVFDAARTSWLGAIQVGRPPGFTLVAGLALAMATALVAFAAWGEVTRKARLTGVLMPAAGLLNVASLQAGVLLELRAKEGEHLARGDVIATMSLDRSTGAGDLTVLVAQALARRRGSLEADRHLALRQAADRDRALAGRERSMVAERLQAEAELDALSGRLRLARAGAERYRRLAGEGFASELQAQQKEAEALDLAGSEHRARRNLIGLDRDLQSLADERAANALAVQMQAIQIEQSLASLSQEEAENAARSRIVLTAPQPSIVSALVASPGQFIPAGQSIATLLPASAGGSELQAHLYAPSRAAGFVRPGHAVRLRYAAYPYQKFGMGAGTVAEVSRTPLGVQDLPAAQARALSDAAQSNEPLYRIAVTLDRQTIPVHGEDLALRPGLLLEADVIQDRRAIWEWMLQPALGWSAGMHAQGPRAMGAPSNQGNEP